MTFEIGIMTFGEVTEDPVIGRLPSPRQRVRETIEQAKVADEVSLDVFGVGEHRRSDFVGSAPTILLAAPAEATENIPLTCSVNPIFLATPIDHALETNYRAALPTASSIIRPWHAFDPTTSSLATSARLRRLTNPA